MRHIFWCVLITLCCGIGFSAFAKDTLDIEIAGYYERSRLARSSESASTFSLNSNSGYRTNLVIDKYFSRWMALTLGGTYASHTYEGSAARIINEPNPEIVGGEAGFKFIFGDFRFFTVYNYEPMMVLVDEAVNIHNLEPVGTGTAEIGFQFAAISRYWDLAFEARGGMAASNPKLEEVELKHQYMVEGAAMIIFGRTNKTLFEVVSLKNIIGSESLFGIKVSLREDSYSFGDDKYTLTNFRAGGFLKFVF